MTVGCADDAGAAPPPPWFGSCGIAATAGFGPIAFPPLGLTEGFAALLDFGLSEPPLSALFEELAPFAGLASAAGLDLASVADLDLAAAFFSFSLSVACANLDGEAGAAVTEWSLAAGAATHGPSVANRIAVASGHSASGMLRARVDEANAGSLQTIRIGILSF
jgi:hypothetical protein